MSQTVILCADIQLPKALTIAFQFALDSCHINIAGGVYS